MHFAFKPLLSSFAVAMALADFLFPTPTKAQTYPIDCAILLCPSGG